MILDLATQIAPKLNLLEFPGRVIVRHVPVATAPHVMGTGGPLKPLVKERDRHEAGGKPPVLTEIRVDTEDSYQIESEVRLDQPVSTHVDIVLTVGEQPTWRLVVSQVVPGEGDVILFMVDMRHGAD